MDRDTVKLNFFNLENIVFQRKKVFNPHCENISIKYKPTCHSKANEMNFSTTWMSTPFGVNSYNNVKKKKYYIDLSFKGHEKSIYIKQLYNIVKKIDNYIPFLVQENEIPLIKAGSLKDYTYVPIIKIIDGEPAIKLKIFPETVKIIQSGGSDVPPGFAPRYCEGCRRDIRLEQISERFDVRAKIHLHSLWIMGKKYGLTWIAKELYIREKRSYCGLPIKSIKHLFHEEDEPGDRIYSKSI